MQNSHFLAIHVPERMQSQDHQKTQGLAIHLGKYQPQIRNEYEMHNHSVDSSCSEETR
jgi:hypothetical protein